MIAMLLIIVGLFFFFVGSLGLLRLPDVLTRAHGAAKCDTLGAFFTLLGLITLYGFSVQSLKLLIIIVFLWVTTPTATHLIAKEIVMGGTEDDTL